MEHSLLIQHSIGDEIRAGGYIHSEADKRAFQDFLKDLNGMLGTDHQYLTEFGVYRIAGSGEIFVKHMPNIQSETARSYMLWQMLEDNIPNFAELVYGMYMHFRSSDEYIAPKEAPSSAHIYVRYDNCFWKLKPRKLKEKLLQLAHSPRDAAYLPLTMRMLASWKPPALREVLIGYLNTESVTHEAVGLPADDSGYAPSLETMRRDLLFSALNGLKYYPSEDVIGLIWPFTSSQDKDVASAAQKSMSAMQKRLK